MVDSDVTPRRAVRPARPRYVAAETLVYPTNEADARRRLNGEAFEHSWSKALPGDPIPDWLVEVSPGIVSKGRAVLAPAGEEA